MAAVCELPARECFPARGIWSHIDLESIDGFPRPMPTMEPKGFVSKDAQVAQHELRVWRLTRHASHTPWFEWVSTSMRTLGTVRDRCAFDRRIVWQHVRPLKRQKWATFGTDTSDLVLIDGKCTSALGLPQLSRTSPVSAVSRRDRPGIRPRNTGKCTGRLVKRD